MWEPADGSCLYRFRQHAWSLASRLGSNEAPTPEPRLTSPRKRDISRFTLSPASLQRQRLLRSGGPHMTYDKVLAQVLDLL